jgi:hypothetical protein
MVFKSNTQDPLQHLPAQGMLQPPQLFSSDKMSMHELLQQAVPASRHGGLHAKQIPFTHEKPGEQTVPHLPQLLLSVCVFVQFVPKQQVFSAGQQLLLQQNSPKAVAQNRPQAPQLFADTAKGVHSPLQH